MYFGKYIHTRPSPYIDLLLWYSTNKKISLSLTIVTVKLLTLALLLTLCKIDTCKFQPSFRFDIIFCFTKESQTKNWDWPTLTTRLVIGYYYPSTQIGLGEFSLVYNVSHALSNKDSSTFWVASIVPTKPYMSFKSQTSALLHYCR